MNGFQSKEALVAAYWRRLARSIDPASARKRKKSSSQARAAERQYFGASRNVKPAIPTRLARASQLPSGGHLRRKINPAIAG
jgi:hypothetical protein